jgi:hypothetical protein
VLIVLWVSGASQLRFLFGKRVSAVDTEIVRR